MDIVADLIKSFDPDSPTFRPTEIYNENWLLKAVLHRAAETHLDGSPLSFSEDATWFSEGLLPTPFRPRHRGDPLAESRTNADGAIGHILIGEEGKADLELVPDARQFVVVEAKISASLSSGTVNVPGFDQAARTVACMAEVLRRARIKVDQLARFAFVVIAPEHSIGAGTFQTEMDRELMRKKIAGRVDMYGGELELWFSEWGDPTVSEIDLHMLSWEHVLTSLTRDSSDQGDSLVEFYQMCLEFN